MMFLELFMSACIPYTLTGNVSHIFPYLDILMLITDSVGPQDAGCVHRARALGTGVCHEQGGNRGSSARLG